MRKTKKAGAETDLILYWTTLLVLITANFFMAIVIIPFMLFAESYQFYLLIALLGLIFGYVFSMLINNIENLQPHHHLVAVCFIPAIAVVNLFVISASTAGLANALGLKPSTEPLTISIVYIASFLAPHAISFAKK
ncbi:hypothetical protein HYX10_05270 [Candidatus Woesearchaeota archaeon]|nr:hypothetical protein [Candidatus Woesearchaeota archaeon]